MKNKVLYLPPRVCPWSENQILTYTSIRRLHRKSGNYPNKVKIILLGSLLAVIVMVMVLSIGNIEDRIYSPHELTRRLTSSNSDTSTATLHLDERYAFDGTHSDFAQQFYRRYIAGDRTEAITDTRDLTEVVDYVREFGLEFASLPAMLQQAVVWDMGYVAAADLGYVKVYTKCGIRMSELQLLRNAYRSAGCTEQRCSSPNGELFYQSMYCTGYQMGNISLCAATNGITPVHGAMWADGGADNVVPVSEMQRHEWTDAAIDYKIMAIHLSGDPNSYGKCVIPSMIIPCVAYDPNTAGENDWCSPKHGEIVPLWLELEKTGGVEVSGSSGWQNAALSVTITSLVLLLLVVIAFIIYWRKIRDQQLRTETLLEKRAILGDRGSDEFSMMDDVDFILEAPDPSFIEKGGQHQTWVAWGHTPAKPKQVITRSVVGQNSEDLDATVLRGSFNDVDSIYLCEESAQRHLGISFRSPSKATTAGLTSFASGITGSPRNSMTLTFTRQTTSTDPASTGSSAGIMASPLVEFQNDPVVASRRVPFVDVSLVRQITTGAYGEVWMGRMRGDIVAVKRLTRERRHQLHELEIFAAEIRLMASLNHPNVIGLLGVAWNTLENMLLIMEYMERGDLHRILQHHSDKEQSSNEVSQEFSWASHKAKIARDISCGLEYLHTLKSTVVHRDLNGVGTAYWTAPEVLAGYKYSEKADVYSLGVVLTELDTGELPFYDARTSDGDKMEAIHILSLVVSGELQPSFTLDCPEDVRELALACLNPKPEYRPTAREVLDELNRLLESDEGSEVV
ncbi:Protein kinase [Phytophthora megakarya]|uniref:Protein kinase n=1 Tax=Phytophthora megakarya TaxID=4795 RepID=A0A225WQ05_9STRA|nr:Protein kinase [Phytophthora megakarya]